MFIFLFLNRPFVFLQMMTGTDFYFHFHLAVLDIEIWKRVPVPMSKNTNRRFGSGEMVGRAGQLPNLVSFPSDVVYVWLGSEYDEKRTKESLKRAGHKLALCEAP